MGVSPGNYSPHIAESVRCVSLLLVSIVLFFFDVSVSYRIYYMYHGFSVYMVNIRPLHLDIGPWLCLGPISRCSGLIFTIYPSKPWYIYYIYNIIYTIASSHTKVTNRLGVIYTIYTQPQVDMKSQG